MTGTSFTAEGLRLDGYVQHYRGMAPVRFAMALGLTGLLATVAPIGFSAAFGVLHVALYICLAWAVEVGARDPDKPKAWLKEAGIDRLGYYHDSKAKAFQELKAVGKALGMPTSVLIDGNGCEIGTLSGPAEWASDDALKLIRAAIEG